VPIFEQDTLLYVLLEVQDTTAEHQRREAINEQLDENDMFEESQLKLLLVIIQGLHAKSQSYQRHKDDVVTRGRQKNVSSR
jgi:hypothetical protein